MLILLIIFAAAALAAGILIASIKMRFRFSDSEQVVSISYLALGLRLNFSDRSGKFCFNGMKIFGFPLKPSSIEEIAKKALLIEKTGRLKLSDIKLEYFKMAGNLISHIRFKELQINIRGGFLEPFYTGKMYGYYWAVKGMYPNLMAHVDFRPDFSSAKLIFEGYGYFYLRLYYIVGTGIRLWSGILKEKKKNIFIIRKRGASYVR